MKKSICEELYHDDFLRGNWARGGYVCGNYLYILKADGALGLKIDYRTKQELFKSIEVKSPIINHYSTQLGDELWMTCYETKSAERYKISENGEITLLDHIDTGDVLAYRARKIGDNVILYPSQESRCFLIYNCVTREVRIMHNNLPDGPCDLWFEVNTLDADDGYWSSTINGTILEFSEADSFKYYLSIANDEITSDFFSEVGKKRKMRYADGPFYEGLGLANLRDYLSNI